MEEDVLVEGFLGEKTDGVNTLGVEFDGLAGIALLGFMNSYCAQTLETNKHKINTIPCFFIGKPKNISLFVWLK